MRVPGFVGPSYQLASPVAGNDRTVNLYPEIREVPGGESQTLLYGVPGLLVDTVFPDGPIRAVFAQEGRVFVIAGTRFYERFGPESYQQRGSVAGSSQNATMCSNGRGGNQLFLTSGGRGYTFNLASNTFALVADADFPANVVMGGYLDGYFVVLTADGRFFLSALNDGTSWDAADVARRSQGSDAWRALVVQPPNLWLFGSQTTEVWYNSGAADFPFVQIPNAFLDVGVAAPFSATPFDGGIAWLGATRAGTRMAYRSVQFTAQRISTHGTEYQWSLYPTVEDAIGYSYQEAGHLFYVLTFPTAGHTWAYDAATQQWHERGAWHGGTGDYMAHPGRCHAVTDTGVHLIGSETDGTLFQQTLNHHRFGNDIRRWMRRVPTLSAERQRLFFGALELAMEVGVGPDAAAQVDLRWSDDGGRTWSNVHAGSAGPIGAYQERVTWQRLGSSRSRQFEFAGSANMQTALLDCYAEVQRGTS